MTQISLVYKICFVKHMANGIWCIKICIMLLSNYLSLLNNLKIETCAVKITFLILFSSICVNIYMLKNHRVSMYDFWSYFNIWRSSPNFEDCNSKEIDYLPSCHQPTHTPGSLSSMWNHLLLCYWLQLFSPIVKIKTTSGDRVWSHSGEMVLMRHQQKPTTWWLRRRMYVSSC